MRPPGNRGEDAHARCCARSGRRRPRSTKVSRDHAPAARRGSETGARSPSCTTRAQSSSDTHHERGIYWPHSHRIYITISATPRQSSEAEKLPVASIAQRAPINQPDNRSADLKQNRRAAAAANPASRHTEHHLRNASRASATCASAATALAAALIDHETPLKLIPCGRALHELRETPRHNSPQLHFSPETIPRRGRNRLLVGERERGAWRTSEFVRPVGRLMSEPLPRGLELAARSDVVRWRQQIGCSLASRALDHAASFASALPVC